MKNVNGSLIRLLSISTLVLCAAGVQPAFADCSSALNPDLMSAVQAGNGDKVDELLSQGACANAVDGTGKSALMYAVEKQSTGAIGSLVDAGADVHAQTGTGVSVLTLVSAITDAAVKGQVADLVFASIDATGAAYFLTFNKDMQPVFKARCTMCHKASPSNYGKYPDISEKKDAILKRVVTKHDMPMQNATGMTDAERNMVGKWIKSGAAE